MDGGTTDREADILAEVQTERYRETGTDRQMERWIDG
jgi:hypothetical protein